MNDNIDYRRLKPADKTGRIKPIKNAEKPLQKYRLLVQIGFALVCIWIGIEFHLFIKYLESGAATGSDYRPPGVEAFLPISSLMSIYYFILTGNIHYAHPAGFFILMAAIVMSVLFGKSFCSWVCPVGFISESLGDLGEKIFKRGLKLPKGLDYPLRSLKYLLLAFFVYSIFFLMTELSLKAFLDSPYNIVADIKMYYFFADISRLALIIIAGLIILSVFIRNFWCRFLCPYGALLGIISFFSPFKIKRQAETCIDCEKCSRVCPSFIKVDKISTVYSDECTGCMKCIDACPVDRTLFIQPILRKKAVSKRTIAAGIVIVFISIIGLAMVGGRWDNKISIQEYRQHRKSLDSYGHPTGFKEIERLNDVEK